MMQNGAKLEIYDGKCENLRRQRRQRNDTRTVTDDKPVKISHRSEAKRRERALKSESSSLMLRLALALPLATGP